MTFSPISRLRIAISIGKWSEMCACTWRIVVVKLNVYENRRTQTAEANGIYLMLMHDATTTYATSRVRILISRMTAKFQCHSTTHWNTLIFQSLTLAEKLEFSISCFLQIYLFDRVRARKSLSVVLVQCICNSLARKTLIEMKRISGKTSRSKWDYFASQHSHAHACRRVSSCRTIIHIILINFIFRVQLLIWCREWVNTLASCISDVSSIWLYFWLLMIDEMERCVAVVNKTINIHYSALHIWRFQMNGHGHNRRWRSRKSLDWKVENIQSSSISTQIFPSKRESVHNWHSLKLVFVFSQSWIDEK